MSSADTPLRPVTAHVHGHDHSHGRAGGAPAEVERRFAHPPLTLLSSGLGYRLGTAAALTALLWAVVLWALA
jgi:hypothetical protein